MRALFLRLLRVDDKAAALAEAFTNACEALDLHLESLQKLGLPLPSPKHRVVVEAA